MAMDAAIRDRLTLPAVCAPMFLVSGPDMVREACKAGIMGALPRQNVRTLEKFDAWLEDIRTGLTAHAESHPGARIGPIAANLATRMPADELRAHLDVCKKHGVEIIISATGDPSELIKQVHDWGGKVFHDVTSMRFAEKAIRANADGLTCVGAGGGGHSGTVSNTVLVPRIRAIFDGVILMAGALATGAAIRAAEILGADLAYMGTRFIASQEARVDNDYKDLLIGQTSADLIYTGKISGVPANWLRGSMARIGLDPDALPDRTGGGVSYDHLPGNAKAWFNVWSAGQGIDLIDDIPTISEIVLRLRREYVAACETPDMADVARIVDHALDA